MTVRNASFQSVVASDELARCFVNNVVLSLTGVAPNHLSLAARVALITIGKGMRLVIDHTNKKGARLLMDPDFSFGHRVEPIDVPASVAHEMIDSGLMKKLDRPGADWWCMIQ